MLPGLDGFSLIDALRRANLRFPVLILSARRSVDDRVKGLQIGGDDYLMGWLRSNASNPQGLNGTDWTTMGSYDDTFVLTFLGAVVHDAVVHRALVHDARDRVLHRALRLEAGRSAADDDQVIVGLLGFGLETKLSGQLGIRRLDQEGIVFE